MHHIVDSFDPWNFTSMRARLLTARRNVPYFSDVCPGGFARVGAMMRLARRDAPYCPDGSNIDICSS